MKNFSQIINLNLYVFLLFIIFINQSSKAQINNSAANTANLNYSIKFLSDYGREYLNTAPLKNLYPEEIRIASLNNLVNQRGETVILIYQSSNEKNKAFISQFLDIWFQLHQKSNFILIDRDKEANYYSNLFVSQYWKGEDFKLIYMGNSGKINFESDKLSSINALKKVLQQKYKNEER